MKKRDTQGGQSPHEHPQEEPNQLRQVNYQALFLENIQLKKENKALKYDVFIKWILLCSAFGLGTASFVFSILGVLGVEDEGLSYAGLGVSTVSFCLTFGGSTKDCITQVGKMWGKASEDEGLEREDFSLD